MDAPARRFLFVCGLLAGCLAGQVVCGASVPVALLARAGRDLCGPRRPAQRWIRQLASEDPLDRAAACQALKQAGLAVFDDLRRGCSSSDVETALCCRRLLAAIDVQPELSSASPLLHDYTFLPPTERLKLIIQLGRLPGAEAGSGLCRIAYYERDDFLAQCAAVEFIARAPLGVAVPVPEADLNASTRQAVRWLHAYRLAGEEPQRLAGLWEPLLDELMDQPPGAPPSATVTWRLLRWYADARVAQDTATAPALARQMAAFASRQPTFLLEASDWLLRHRQCSELIALADATGTAYRDDPLLRFRLAEAHWLIGRWVNAIRFGHEAAEGLHRDPLREIQCGLQLQHAGLGRWARQLYRQAMVHAEDSASRLQAALLLADSLDQAGEPGAAARVLEEALPASGSEMPRGSVEPLPGAADPLWARAHYLRALAYQRHGRSDLAKSSLIAGLECDSQDPNLLIALYQWGPQDAAWQRDVEQLVEQGLRGIENEIQQCRDELEMSGSPSALRQRALANALNRYAWLAINTDRQVLAAGTCAAEAVSLAPGNAPFLDTLAQCHYRRGNWTQAVACQRQAVMRQPANRRLSETLLRYQQSWAAAELTKMWR